MKMKLGDLYDTNTSGMCKVIDIQNAAKVTVEFLDTGTKVCTTAQNIRNGEVRDWMYKDILGVACLGIGPYNESANRDAKLSWRNMLHRCYSERVQLVSPTYIGCKVSEKWLNFQNFAEWFENYPNRQKGWHVDKDILIPGNKIYSEDTCCLVPQAINKLLLKADSVRGKYPIGVCFDKSSGTLMVQVSDGKGSIKLKGFQDEDTAFLKYKEIKREVIRKQAEKYKDVLQENVYNALINYEINEERQP